MLSRAIGAASLILAWTSSQSSWAGDSQTPSLDDIVLARAGGEPVQLQKSIAAHRLTVVVFFSSSCPCFTGHRERLGDMARDLAPKGVDFLVVDSERHAAGDARPATVPGTTLSILRDDGGRLARRLGAQYATESFVFDSGGHLRYRGGIDDQRKQIGPNAKPHLRDALVGLLNDHAPAYATAKALGCVLRLM